MLLEREVELIFLHVQDVKKKIRTRRTMERAGEGRPRKVAMARLAVDLILQQGTSRGKELVLFEMQPAPVEEQTLLLKLSLYLFLAPFLPFSLFSCRYHHRRFNFIGSHSRDYPPASLSQETACSSNDELLHLSRFLFISLSRSYLSVLSMSIFVRTSCIPLLYNSLLNKDCILTRYLCDGGC